MPAPSHSVSIESKFLGILSRATSEDELLTELALEIGTRLHADSCDFLYKDVEDSLILRASTVVPEMNNRFRMGKGIGISSKVASLQIPIFIESGAERHESYARFPGVAEGIYEAIAAIPLITESKTCIGVLAMKWNKSKKFPPDTKQQILEIAHASVLTIRGFSTAYSSGAQMNRLGALSEVARTITASPYLEEILQLLVNLTAQQFDYRVCTVRLLDEQRQELVLRATQAPAKAYQNKRAIKLGESIAGRAISTNKPVIVPDVQKEADYIGHDLAEEQGLRSMICVPLALQDKAVGVLSCYTSEVREFADDEIAALETLAKQAAYSIEHAKLQVRDTLMQEMHHRVKNNLQQVASLMRLQLRHGQYKSLEEALNDTLARILAIAAVHDLLSRDDLDHVGMRSISESLVQHQDRSLISPNKTIRFQVRGDDVTLGMNQATTVALVLNELILNAVEHGFKVTDHGEIHVTIEEKEGDVSVWVSNSGDQLPPGFNPEVASHLGLQIVENLSRALGGKFKLSEILGWTVAEVKFPRATSE